MNLYHYIKSLVFENKRIGVDGSDNNHFCYFGFSYNDQDGKLKIYQNGDVYFCLGVDIDELLDGSNLDEMEERFDFKHGVAMCNVRFVAQAYDAVSISLKEKSDKERDELLQVFKDRITEECKEFNDSSNIGKWIAWCYAFINHPDDYEDAITGKRPRKVTDPDELYVNIENGLWYSFVDKNAVIKEPKSIVVCCEDMTGIKADKIQIIPKHNYKFDVIDQDTNEVKAVSIDERERYLVSTKSISYYALYDEARQPKKMKL